MFEDEPEKAFRKENQEKSRMARRETITVDGVRKPCLNVSETVGEKFGANKAGDVMLVQAMFKYMVRHFPPEELGLTSKDELPEVSGFFDSATAHLINALQRKLAHLLLRVDGIIHPASYKDRNLKFSDGKERMMTITALHFLCEGASPIGVDYTTEITRQFPQLLPWLKR